MVSSGTTTSPPVLTPRRGVLRYELREDRKREASRNYRNLDNLRRDMVALFREELGGGLSVPSDGRAYSSDCGPDTIYRKPSRRGQSVARGGPRGQVRGNSVPSRRHELESGEGSEMC